MTFNCDACDFCEPRKSRCRKLESLPMVGEYAEAKTCPTWCPLTALESQLMTECGRLREALSVDKAALEHLRQWLRDRTAERDGLLAGCRRIRRCGTGNVWHWSADPDDIAAFDAAIAACETPKAGG
jgi:hypothetical protein